MNQRFLKEVRSMAPAWLAALALTLFPLCLQTLSQFTFAPAFIYAGATLLAIACFGTEFNLQTLPLLLSQPIPRYRFWLEKMAILITAIGSIFALLWFCIHFHLLFFLKHFDNGPWPANYQRSQLEYCGWLLICALCGGPFWTLILRNATAALAACLFSPLFISFLLEAIAGIFHTGEFSDQSVQTAFALYSMATAILAFVLFRRMQMIDSLNQEFHHAVGSQNQTVNRLAGLFNTLPRPWPQLLAKEIRLQNVNLLTAAGLATLWIALATLWKLQVKVDALAFSGIDAALRLILPLMIGSAAIAEERRLGTFAWHQMLPLSRRRQFTAKLGMCALVVALLAWALPSLLLKTSLAFGLNFDLLELPGYWLIPSLAVIAFFASSMAKDFLNAFLLAIGIALVIPLGITLDNVFEIHELYRNNEVGHIGWILLWALGGTSLIYAYYNYCRTMSVEESAASRSHLLIRVARSLFLVLGLGLLFYGIENWRGENAWDQYAAEQTSLGVQMHWPMFIPDRVPTAENFAMTPLLAPSLDYRRDLGGSRVWRDTNGYNRLQKIGVRKSWVLLNPELIGWDKGEHISLLEWQIYYRGVTNFPSGSLSPELFNKYAGNDQKTLWDKNANFVPTLAATPQTPAADVLLALSQFDSAVAELKTACARPYARFPVHYQDNREEMELFHLHAVGGIVTVLELRATAELELGQNEEAIKDIKVALRLAEALKSEPFLWSHFIQVIMHQHTLQPIWEGLADHRWTGSQLKDLQQDLSAIDLVSDFARLLQAERAAEVEQKTLRPDSIAEHASGQFQWEELFNSESASDEKRVHLYCGGCHGDGFIKMPFMNAVALPSCYPLSMFKNNKLISKSLPLKFRPLTILRPHRIICSPISLNPSVLIQ